MLGSYAFTVIPSADMWGILEATKPEYRQYSPFWGNVALEGGMLKALRLYGNYTLSTDSHDRQIDIASKNDPIAQLIIHLFPSPDGFSFLPNTWIREPGGFLSRHIESVNDIISVLISEIADKKSKILDILRPQKEGRLIYGKGDDALSKVNAERFIDALLNAHDYNNTEKEMPYPHYTAITALNAFFIAAAEKVEDLEKLSILMKNDFSASKDLKSFTVEDYKLHHPKMRMIFANANKDPELAFLLAYGQDHFNNQSLTNPLLEYRNNVCITLENRKKSSTFSDCGETSIRNFFWKISHLSPLTLQEFFKNIESENQDITSNAVYSKMKEFVLNESLLGQVTQEAYDNWAQILSGLNTSSELNFDNVAYVRSNFFEMEADSDLKKKNLGGIYNWLNVMAKLIPDSILTESWGEVRQPSKCQEQELNSKLSKKLDRLCKLVSPNLSYNSTKAIPYQTLEFLYLGEPYFSCEFSSYHYKCILLKKGNVDWREPYHNLSLENPWLGSIFNRITAKGMLPVNLGYVFNSSIFNDDKIYNIFSYIFHTNLEYFESLLNRWIKKKNLLATSANLEKLVKVLVPNLTKSLVQRLIEDFPILKGETVKALVRLKDNATIAISSFLFAGGDLKILKDNQEICFAPLKFAYSLEHFDTMFTMLDLWNEDRIQIEYQDFKEVFVRLVSKSNDNLKPQKRRKKQLKMEQQLQVRQKKLLDCANKMISLPRAARLVQEEKIDLIEAVIQTPCSVALFKNLMNSFGSSLTAEQKTDILRNNRTKSNFPLLSVLIEKGANDKDLQNMQTKN